MKRQFKPMWKDGICACYEVEIFMEDRVWLSNPEEE